MSTPPGYDRYGPFLDTLSASQRALVLYVQGMPEEMRFGWLISHIDALEGGLSKAETGRLSQANSIEMMLTSLREQRKGDWTVTAQQRATWISAGGFIASAIFAVLKAVGVV